MSRTVEKAERQRVLLGLISDHDVRSQEQACELLARNGIVTTQATVSRDLDEVGAVKVRGPDGTLVYRLPNEAGQTDVREHLVAVMRQFVLRVGASGGLVVLRTPPAAAGPVASAIDQAEPDGVLATLAGDDTVIVIAEEGLSGAELASRFRRLLNRPPNL